MLKNVAKLFSGSLWSVTEIVTARFCYDTHYEYLSITVFHLLSFEIINFIFV